MQKFIAIKKSQQRNIAICEITLKILEKKE